MNTEAQTNQDQQDQAPAAGALPFSPTLRSSRQGVDAVLAAVETLKAAHPLTSN